MIGKHQSSILLLIFSVFDSFFVTMNFYFQFSTSLEETYPQSHSKFVSKLDVKFNSDVYPTYRIMDEHGNILNEEEKPKLSNEAVVNAYKTMLTVNILDTILYDVQRQGNLSSILPI